MLDIVQMPTATTSANIRQNRATSKEEAFVVFGWVSTDYSSYCQKDEEGFECCKCTVEMPVKNAPLTPENTDSMDHNELSSIMLPLNAQVENEGATADSLSEKFDTDNRQTESKDTKSMPKQIEIINCDMATSETATTPDEHNDQLPKLGENAVDSLNNGGADGANPCTSKTIDNKDTNSINTNETTITDETPELITVGSTFDARSRSGCSKGSSQPSRSLLPSPSSLPPLLVRVENTSTNDVYAQEHHEYFEEDCPTHDKSIECILPTIVFVDELILHDVSNVNTCLRSGSNSTSHYLDGIQFPEYLLKEYQTITNAANMKPKIKHPQEQVIFDEDNPWDAAKRGDFMALQRFEATQNIDWTALDDFELPPLYYACQSGADSDMESLRFLLRIWPTLNLPAKLVEKCKTDAINNHVIKLIDLADNPDMDTVAVDNIIDDYDSAWGARARSRAPEDFESYCECELASKLPLLNILDRVCGDDANNDDLINQSVMEDETSEGKKILMNEESSNVEGRSFCCH